MLLFCLVHVCVFVYVSSRQYLGVWGELASHKRSLTHHPSSQGWASTCLVLSVFVGMVLMSVHVYGFMGFTFLLPLFSWCTIHMWFHAL